MCGIAGIVGTEPDVAVEAEEGVAQTCFLGLRLVRNCQENSRGPTQQVRATSWLGIQGSARRSLPEWRKSAEARHGKPEAFRTTGRQSRFYSRD